MTRLKTFAHGATLSIVDMDNIMDDGFRASTTARDLWSAGATGSGLLSATTYMFTRGTSPAFAAVTSTHAINAIHFDPEIQVASNGNIVNFRLEGYVVCNTTAPGTTLSVALKSVAGIDSSNIITTLGSALVSATISTPAANSYTRFSTAPVSMAGKKASVVTFNLGANQAANSLISAFIKVKYNYV